MDVNLLSLQIPWPGEPHRESSDPSEQIDAATFLARARFILWFGHVLKIPRAPSQMPQNTAAQSRRRAEPSARMNSIRNVEVFQLTPQWTRESPKRRSVTGVPLPDELSALRSQRFSSSTIVFTGFHCDLKQRRRSSRRARLFTDRGALHSIAYFLLALPAELNKKSTVAEDDVVGDILEQR